MVLMASPDHAGRMEAVGYQAEEQTLEARHEVNSIGAVRAIGRGVDAVARRRGRQRLQVDLDLLESSWMI